MTSIGVTRGRVSASVVPGRQSRVRWAVAAVIAVFTVLLALAPATHFAHSSWVALGLCALATLWCALPTHRHAAAGLVADRLSLEVLPSLAMLASLAWAVVALVDGHSAEGVLAGAAVVALLMTLADQPDPVDVRLLWLVPLVLAVVGAELVGSWVLGGALAGTSAALAVLIAACPATLMLSGSLVLRSARTRGTALGIHISGLGALQTARRVDTIVLDKEQTITTGDKAVFAVTPIDPGHKRNMTWFAGALEHHATHPIGRAIARGAPRGHVTDFEEQQGLGISGSVDRHPVRVGSPRWIGLTCPDGLGASVAVEVDGRALGHITLVDEVRPHASDSITRLRGLGIDVVLVSDDNSQNTAQLAAAVGITRHVSPLPSPARAAWVDELRSNGAVVAFAGPHEANAAALEQADLGIADAASLSSGPVMDRIILDDLDAASVARGLELARSTLTRVERNRWLALGLTLAGVAVAAATVVGPLGASLIALGCVAAVAVAAQFGLRTR